jgi:hypothetical protein
MRADYVQQVLLFFGPYTTLVSFLNIFNFNIAQSTTSCLAPLSPTGQLLTGVAVPVLCLGQLLLFGAFHWLLWRVSGLCSCLPAVLKNALPSGRSPINWWVCMRCLYRSCRLVS